MAHESTDNEHDVVYLWFNQPGFNGRHVFAFGDSEDVRVGDEIGFLGYPFQMEQLTCHLGYVASVHPRGRVQVIQIDGSINGENSGGPLINFTEGRVVGMVSRTEVGFLADQFDALIRALGQNVQVLQGANAGVRMTIGGIDPVQELLASQAAMLQIAANLRRSANVGIGYAFGTNFITDRIAELQAGTS